MQRLQREEPVARVLLLSHHAAFLHHQPGLRLADAIFLGKAERTRDSVLIDLYAVS